MIETKVSQKIFQSLRHFSHPMKFLSHPMSFFEISTYIMEMQVLISTILSLES